MSPGFIKLNRDSDPDLLNFLIRRPNAWTLLTSIALRARRDSGIDPRSGISLMTGEALVGDFESFGLTRGQYRAALNHLKRTGIVTTKTTNRGTVVKLVSSTIYDINENSNDLQNDHQGDQRTTTNKNVKKLKEKTLVGFDVFWQACPRKIGKQAAVKAWGKVAPSFALQSIILESLEHHKVSEQWQRDNGQFIPHPATWLNGRRWEDELTTISQPTYSENNPIDHQTQQAALAARVKYGLST